jgi:hypoxanthine phosphoribosyltransferase
MQQVRIKDKTFSISISTEAIQRRVAELGNQIEADYKDKTPVFIPVLNGSVFFFADLLKHINCECEISFVRLASYNGTQSSGEVKNILGLTQPVKDRHVIIVEDIVDSGLTLSYLYKHLEQQQPASVKVAALLFKPQSIKHPVSVDYVGFEVDPDFLVGYGLDYNGLGRNLNDIYKLSS